MLVLVLLSAAYFVAAAFVSSRGRFESRAEFLLSCCLLWNFFILVPIHSLGLLNWLTPLALALCSILFVACAIGASFIQVASAKAHWQKTLRALRESLALPFEALAVTFRARSLVFVGFVVCGSIIAWTILLSYLVPSDSWDGVWYHELTIGYAMQHHGYAPIRLPTDVPFPASMIQQANGYPRNCEMTNFWFVVFSGRDLVEVVNSLAAIPLMLAMYMLTRRFTPSRVVSLGWACALATLPVVAMQFRSTYMDVHVAAFYLGALHFCTRPNARLSHAWLGMVALSLAIGAKSIALAVVPLMWLALAASLVFYQLRSRTLAASLTLVCGSVLIVAMASVCYVRNWVLFKNPIWPMSYELPALGIDWRGLAPINAITNALGQPTAFEMFKIIAKYRPPGGDFADTGTWAYGDAIPFVVIPLGLLAAAVLVARLALEAFGAGRPSSPDRIRTLNMAFVVLVLLGIALATPTLFYPRYNIHVVAGPMLLIAWLGRRGNRLSEGVIVATLAANFLFLARATPGWGITAPQALEYLKSSTAERDTMAASPFSIPTEVAIARDRELGAGSVVAFAADVAFVFVAQLWNEHYTNKLFYVPPRKTEEFLKEADALGAKWVVAGESSLIARDLRKHHGWQYVGLVSRGYPSVAFRRR